MRTDEGEDKEMERALATWGLGVAGDSLKTCKSLVGKGRIGLRPLSFSAL